METVLWITVFFYLLSHTMTKTTVSGVNRLKKYLVLSVILMFMCGTVLRIAYEASGGAVWSLLVSGVNRSPWEQTKPYALVYLMWTFLDLSVLRPKLLHFVSARLISLHCFTGGSLLLLSLSGSKSGEETYSLLLLGGVLSAAVLVEYLLYRQPHRIEFLMVPLLVASAGLLLCLMFLTFYPPDWVPFRDIMSD